MGREQQDLPSKDDEEIDREAQKNRDKLDDIPAPGSDPLHEGP
jgi:hypothetical protein